MTVDKMSGIMEREGGGRRGQRDQFPVGMRVLAVDDDLTCLKVLETMLRHCQYHVTTTNQATKALKMLRENKDKFDLVISDVHMPDMDGFKLLELVGLEMDLPVIMLSANGETKAVMKGITHGACDYLLKPVRIEELKNIWQHVIRRRKFDPRNQNNSDNGEDCENPQHEQGPLTSGSSDIKLNRKRKDQNEEGEDDNEENMNENEDSSTQKKPRVVWSVELHRKFVAVVDHLGIDKAVPKRILDLMNVAGLTRENVASHLQKYRLYLKRRSAMASQQANMVAALGVRDPSYLPMASLDGFGDFYSLTASSQLPAFPSFQHSGVLNRTNPNVLGLHGLSPGIAQVGHTHNTSNPINDLSELQHITGNQHGNLLQGMPTTLGPDQLQKHRRIQEANNCFPGGFSTGGRASGSSNNSIVNVTNNPLLLQAHHSSIEISSISSDPFEVSAGVSSHFPDLGRCNDTWQSAVPSTGYTANTLAMGACVTPVVSQINCNPLNFSSSSAVVTRLSDPVIGSMMLMPRGADEDSKYLNFRSVGNSQQKWGEAKQDHTHEMNVMFSSSLNPPLAGQSTIDSTAHNQKLNNGIYSKRVDRDMISQTNYSAPFLTQHCKIDKSIANGQMKYKDDYILEPSKLQGGLSSNGCSFDDLVNAVVKPEREDVIFMDG